MSEHKTDYTPGPWKRILFEIWTPDTKVATVSWNRTKSRTTSLANARLIAAAPEMLAALKLIEPVLADDRNGELSDLAAMASAAIAKAEGR